MHILHWFFQQIIAIYYIANFVVAQNRVQSVEIKKINSRVTKQMYLLLKALLNGSNSKNCAFFFFQQSCLWKSLVYFETSQVWEESFIWRHLRRDPCLLHARPWDFVKFLEPLDCETVLNSCRDLSRKWKQIFEFMGFLITSVWDQVLLAVEAITTLIYGNWLMQSGVSLVRKPCNTRNIFGNTLGQAFLQTSMSCLITNVQRVALVMNASGSLRHT